MEQNEYPLGKILIWIAGVGAVATAMLAALLSWGFE
jgi:hypothetical protein